MPRPRPGHSRPSETKCRVCGGTVPVAVKGRLPEAHPECAQLAHDVQRALVALEAATQRAGIGQAELLAIRSGLWVPRLIGEANRIWNRVANPAKRRREPSLRVVVET